MGIKNEEIKISYQKITPADFIPDINGAFDVLFAEILKDCKEFSQPPIQLQKGYCNVFQSNIS